MQKILEFLGIVLIQLIFILSQHPLNITVSSLYLFEFLPKKKKSFIRNINLRSFLLCSHSGEACRVGVAFSSPTLLSPDLPHLPLQDVRVHVRLGGWLLVQVTFGCSVQVCKQNV